MGGAAGDAKAPGVNTGPKALELVAAGVEPEPAGAPCSPPWIRYLDRSEYPGTQDRARDKGRNRDRDHGFVRLGRSAPSKEDIEAPISAKARNIVHVMELAQSYVRAVPCMSVSHLPDLTAG